MAYEMLEGFGDVARGEWTEDRPQAFHLRRRLTAEEQTQVGPAVDCRGTEEAVRRFEAMKTVMHPATLPLAMEELIESAGIPRRRGERSRAFRPHRRIAAEFGSDEARGVSPFAESVEAYATAIIREKEGNNILD